MRNGAEAARHRRRKEGDQGREIRKEIWSAELNKAAQKDVSAPTLWFLGKPLPGRLDLAWRQSV